MINFCQEIFWSRIEILLKLYRNLIGIFYEEILRTSYGTNLMRWVFCQDGERVSRQQSCPLGKICLENSLKLWMWDKNRRDAIVHTRYILCRNKPNICRFGRIFGSFLNFLAYRLFIFLGLSCFHRLLTNFPFLPRIKGTFSHLKSFSNFAVIFNGFE